MTDTYTVDVTEQNFETEVLARSQHTPVLVDFWAPWCQPCQMLLPVLAKLAAEYEGRFVLVRINTDENQELAMQFGVRSLPTVKLLVEGRIVDEFMGALPEGQVRAFLDAHVQGGEDDDQLQQVQELAQSGDLDAALAQAARLVDEDPGDAKAATGYAELLLLGGKADEAESVLESIDATERDSDPVKRLHALIHFSRIAATSADRAELYGTLGEQPDNVQARYEVAAQEVLAGDYEQAMSNLFSIFSSDRKFADDGARKGLLALFSIAPDADYTSRYRRQMFTLLH